MPISSRIEVKGYLDSLPSGSLNILPNPLTSADAPGEITTRFLVGGDNTFIPPAKSKGALIVYPAVVGTYRLLKGHADDVGIKLGLTAGFTILTLDTDSLSDIIIEISANDDLPTTVVYF